MKWYTILLGIACLLLLASPASAWLSYEPYGKTLQVQGQTNWYGDVANYSLPITIYRSSGTDSASSIYVGTNCNANYSDIRFTDNSDNLLPYWIETSSSSSANVWVRLNTTAKASLITYKLYYGNASFSEISNPNTTWDLYDSFDGASLNASKWSSSGSITQSGGKATLGSGASIASLGTYQYEVLGIWNATRPNTVEKQGFTPHFKGVLGSNQFQYVYSSTGYQVEDGTGTGYSRMALGTPRMSGGYQYTGFGINTNALSLYQSDAETAESLTFTGAQILEWVALGKTGYSSPTYAWSESTPTATNFTANVTSGPPGMNVSFTDYSTGSPSAWNWSYGDGTANGTSKNVTHVYSNAGVYTVNLTTSLYGVNNTMSRSAYINVGQAPGAAFIANKTSGTNPTTILFNDTSSLTPTNWNWSFGDGGSNATTQNATRTFTSSGSYPVVLTAGNAYGSTSTSTTITVMSSNNASGYGQYYAAKTVTFHIQSAFGAPITGATVTMQGLSTSSGSWDWLGQLLGIRFNETPVNTQLMSALTDSNGDAQFFVFPTTIYQVNITKTGEISKSIQVTPTEERYTVPLDLNIFGSVGKDINGVTQFNVTTSQYNTTAMKITVIGTDTMNHITGGIVRLNQTNITANGTEIQLDSQPIPANNFTINFVVNSYAGKSYFVRINATQSDFGTVKRDFGVSFPKEKVNPMGLDNKMLMYGSILVLILCGAVFTTTTSYNGALLTCFVGWILYAVGWMEYAGTIMPIALTFATILSVAIIVIARRNAT